jgi:hypothetical protein
LLVVTGFAGELADFLEGAGVEQPRDALAHRELALGVVALDRRGAAALLGECPPAMNFLDFRFPAHGSSRARRGVSSRLGPGQRGCLRILSDC